ncbi:MAG: ribonuclease R [Rhodospirillaceae bacterium]
MAIRKKDAPVSTLPTKADILAYVQRSSKRLAKRDIARAFNIRGADRPAFKEILKELEAEGSIDRGGKRRFAEAGRLPDVAVLDAIRTDDDGDLIGQPANWEEKTAPPIIFILPSKEVKGAIGVGDRVLAKMKLLEDGIYQARPIRKLTGGPKQILGVCEKTDHGGFLIRPVDRRERQTITVDKAKSNGAQHGDLVLVTLERSAKRGFAKGRVIETLHNAGIEKALSLIAIHSHGIPHEWTAAALEQAEQCGPAPLGKRTDLRDLPLVTIDGSDARDFDDAVWAEQDQDPSNSKGWHLIVAIADVSWYVTPGSPLDTVSHDRGNSTYFPDRVVPMLPEALSNGWCSLRPNEDRPCLAVHIWIDVHGELLHHKFVRGLMRSHARLTYEQVQAAADGHGDDTTTPLLDTVIKPLYGAYACLDKARKKRGALALDIPERKILINDEGQMTGVEPRARLASHQLIEEFMVAANVAAAQTLQRAKAPGLYRVHEPPDPERVDSLRVTLESMELKLNSTGSIRAKDFNYVLEAAKNDPAESLVNTMILRTQSQARYEPENLGHFGLALNQYTHFTSPIRRYSDLIVHRSLIRELKLGKGGLESDAGALQATAEHISMTERRSSTAERETVDRYTAAFLANQIGATFAGRVNGVSRFGLFVTLAGTGADGILPIKRLPDDYYDVFEDAHMLAGRHSGLAFSVGDPITVTLTEADAMTGGLAFNYVDHTPLRERASGSQYTSKHTKYGQKPGHKPGRKSGRSRVKKAGRRKKRS